MRRHPFGPVAAVATLLVFALGTARPLAAADAGKAAKPPEKKADKPADKPSDKPSDKPAAKPGDKPADKAAEKKGKFPGPVVDQLLKGWDGVAWGATLDEFKKKNPDAKEAAGGRWVTGRGPSDMAGQPVTAEYGFSKKGQLALIRFEPAEGGRKTFIRSLVEAGAAREGPKPGWQNNGVTFQMAEVNGDQFAVAVNARHIDPPEKKPAAAK